MSDKPNLRIVTFGIEASVLGLVEKFGLQVAIENQPYDLEKMVTEPLPDGTCMVLCGPAPEGISINEVAQTLRAQYQDLPIFYLTTQRVAFDRKIYCKNGFTEAFLLLPDEKLLKETLQKELARTSQGLIRSYRSVRMVDIVPGQELGFDLFLHLKVNNKYVKFAAGDKGLDEKRVARLKKRDVTSMHVSTDQLSHFYKFTARQLKNLSGSDGIGETEKRARRETAVRELLSDLFVVTDGKDDAFSKGREVMTNCQEIVKAYVSDVSGGKKSWYERLLENSGEEASGHSHAANVATLAAMFSIGLGIGNPDDLALAGLLHDIGLADVPSEIQIKAEADRTPEERQIYQKHPTLSVEIVKSKKLIVSEKVMKIIVQHHERFSGKGYPNAVAGDRIAPEAQILALADYFDYVMSAKDGRAMINPAAALAGLIADNSKSSDDMQFDPVLLQKLSALFPAPAATDSGSAAA